VDLNTHNGAQAAVPGGDRRIHAIVSGARWCGTSALEELAGLFMKHWLSGAHSFRAGGPEFAATAMREWLKHLRVKTLYIVPGNPWENGYCERFNARLRELLDGELLTTLLEAQVVIERWRQHYNHVGQFTRLPPTGASKPRLAMHSG